jgi:GT2 family glycosyltransferase
MPSTALVSAIVCTRNRPAPLVRAVRSLLASDHEELEVLVVDQSDGMESERAIAMLMRSNPRLAYMRSAARGKGAAMNQGLARARGDLVACTDDDCEASAGWVTAMVRAIEQQPTAAIALCNVTAAPYDNQAGYVPNYERQQSRLLTSIGACRGGLGFGAGMILRRDAILGLGGYDERFGPGSQFASGDDHDLCHRVLLKGWHVYETVDVSILHHGFLTFDEGRQHTRRDWTSAGAAGAKLLRAGGLEGATVPLWIFSAYAVWPPLFDLLRFRRPRKVARIAGFVRGFAAGLTMPIDRTTLIFRGTPPIAQR